MTSILLVTSDCSSMGWSGLEKFETECSNNGWQYDSGNCILIDYVKSSDDCSTLVHIIGTGACIDSDKTNLAYLVGWSYDMSGW